MNKWMKKMVVLLAAVSMIAVVGFGGMGVASVAGVRLTQIQAAEAPAPAAKTIVVTGRGVVRVKPNVAIVTLGIQTDNADAKAAQTENNTKMTAMIAAVKALGIADADIQTSNYYMYPKYDYEKNDAIIGYTVTNSVSVTVRDINKAGEVVDAGVTAGANSTNNIQFGLSDTTAYYENALTAAIANAKSKGAVLAKAIGVTVGAPAAVVEMESYSMPVAEASVAKDMSAGEPGMPVQIGELEVTAAVEVTYTY